MEKLGTWKFSLEQFAQQVATLLLEKNRVRWDNTIQTITDIFGETLKQLVPSLIEPEVQKALKEHVKMMILKFNTCLILMKNVEWVVKSANDVWKDVYHLHKPSEDLVEIKDDESDKEEDDEDDNKPSFIVTAEETQYFMKDGEE